MGMTLTEKILAKASGNTTVSPGQIVMARPRVVATMDTQAKMVFQAFEKLGLEKMPNPDLFAVIFDHRVPDDDVNQAELHKYEREMLAKYGIKKFHDIGRGGIMHQILAEQAYAFPGQLTVATESHTPTSGAVGGVVAGIGASEAACALATGDVWLRVPSTIKIELTGELPPYVMTKDVALKIMSILGYERDAVYMAVEFAGDGLKNLSMDSRLTLANMVADVGAKNAIFPVDDVTVEYFKGRTDEPVEKLSPDPDAHYDRVITINMSELEPLLAVHPDMDNIHPVSEIEKQRIPVNMAFVGTCTNGRYEDLAITAEILKGRKIAPNVRFCCAPASQEVFIRAAKDGLLNTIAEAGVEFTPVGCSACAGTHQGVIGDGEVAITAGPRNWVGRMGSKKGIIYLGSPAIVAASAIAGYICSPNSIK